MNLFISLYRYPPRVLWGNSNHETLSCHYLWPSNTTSQCLYLPLLPLISPVVTVFTNASLLIISPKNTPLPPSPSLCLSLALSLPTHSPPLSSPSLILSFPFFSRCPRSVSWLRIMLYFHKPFISALKRWRMRESPCWSREWRAGASATPSAPEFVTSLKPKMKNVSHLRRRKQKCSPPPLFKFYFQ